MKTTHRFYRVTVLLLAVVSASLTATATESAADILRSLARKMGSAPAVEATFTVNGGDNPVQGSIVMAGAKFAMTTPVLSVWYDGNDQWTMLESTGEVNITTPGRDELMQCNPFSVINNYRGHYTARRLSDSNGRKRVELTPAEAGTGLDKVIIVVSADGWPAAVHLVFDDGRSVIAAVDHITATAAKPMTAFRFDPALHPSMSIVDLR